MHRGTLCLVSLVTLYSNFLYGFAKDFWRFWKIFKISRIKWTKCVRWLLSWSFSSGSSVPIREFIQSSWNHRTVDRLAQTVRPTPFRTWKPEALVQGWPKNCVELKTGQVHMGRGECVYSPKQTQIEIHYFVHWWISSQWVIKHDSSIGKISSPSICFTLKFGIDKVYTQYYSMCQQKGHLGSSEVTFNLFF